MKTKYFKASSIRLMRFLYSLGFEKESFINEKGYENWKFEHTPELQEALDFYFNPRKNGKERPVCKLDDAGNIISTYSSLTEASNELNPNRNMTSNIYYAIKNNGICYGYHWNYLQ